MVSALLSAPFATKAQSTNTVKINGNDTIAGQSTVLEISNTGPYNEILVELSKPNGEKVTLNSSTDAFGKSEIRVSNDYLKQAGVYLIAAKNLTKNSALGKYSSFNVKPGILSEQNSYLKFDRQTANSGEKIRVQVKLLDDYSNPISGHRVKLESNRVKDTIYATGDTTNKNGAIDFYVSSTEKGISELRAKDTTINKSLNQRVKLAFLTGTKNLSRTKIIFASENNASSLTLTGLNTEVKVGDKQSITVRAADGSGLTITNYTGTIQFTSSDANASLPNNYTFVTADQGEHTFDLGFSFVTPGAQTIRATDINQTNITGATGSTIVTSFSDLEQSVDYQSNYESQDFERKGDFTLGSPATGSYSTNSIEVQGDADYGYTAVIYLNDEEAARTEVTKDNSFDYSLKNLEDGNYDLYVDIVDTELNDKGEEVIKEKIETSDVEAIVIDTTPAELLSLTFDPGTSVSGGDTFTATVLSESKLDGVTFEINGEVYELSETTTGGKYQGEIVAPNEAGDYSVNVVLKDSLGNEADYRDQETITVDKSSSTGTSAGAAETLIPAPTGLSSASGRGEVTVSWEPAVSADGSTISFYRLYYGPSKEELFATSDTYDASTTWLITDLAGGEKYYFAVAAVDSTGNESELSDTVVGIPLGKAKTSEFVPSAPEPELAKGALPTNSPETGPGTNLLIALSLIGSVGYFGTRKLAKQKFSDSIRTD